MTDTAINQNGDATLGKIHVTFAVIQFIVCFICLLFAMYCHCIIHDQNRRKVFELRKTSKMVPLCTFLGLFSFLISSLSLGINTWTSYNHGNYTKVKVTSIIDTFCWSLGQFCSYLVFFFRSISVFSGSAYPVSTVMILYLVFLMTLFEAAWITKAILPFCYWSNITSLEYGKTMEFINIGILCVDVLITLSMTHLFISRLFVVMRRLTETLYHHQHLQMDALHQSLNVDGRNHQMMKLSVKITVLSCVSLVSSLLVVSLATIVDISLDFNGAILPITNFWIQIDTVISALCLVLFLVRAERMYNIVCCGCNALGYQCMRRTLMKWRDRSRRSFESSLQSTPTTSLGISSGVSNAVNMQSDPMLMTSDSQSKREGD